MRSHIICVHIETSSLWAEFVNKNICKCSSSNRGGLNFNNFENSHNSFLSPEYFIDYFCVNGFHVRLRHPSCVYFSAQRQYNTVQKCVHLSNNFPCISFLDIMNLLFKILTEGIPIFICSSQKKKRGKLILMIFSNTKK